MINTSNKEKFNKLIKYSIYFYIILIVLSFVYSMEKYYLKYIFSILLLSHILILYIITFPIYKNLNYFYFANGILVLFFFRRFFIHFEKWQLAYLICYYLVFISTFYFKTILYKMRIADTIKNIAPRLKPLIEVRFEIEEKVNTLHKENLDLEFQKMNINKIYNQIKIINSTLALKDMMEVSKKILIDVIGLNNFVFFIKGNDKNYNQALEYNLDKNMKKYLKNFLKKKGENFFLKINSYVRFAIEPEEMGYNLTNVNIFPLILKEEILGMLVQFETNKIKIDESIISNVKIVIRYISMGIKKAMLYNKVQELSQKDGLTSLYIRRVFNEFLEEEFLRAKRYNTKLCLIILDIDFFKKLNDKYGHLFGDKVLFSIAQIILDQIKLPITASRYGGEEFVLICPNVTKAQAFDIAENIRKKVKEFEFMYNRTMVHTTISGGIAEYTAKMKKSNDLLEKADKNLYKAKKSGRNKIIK